ncbi:MAG: ferritin-like domain-containing protein [Adhaeribacter sp.]
MNLFNLISEIEKADPEVYERLDSRRAVFKHFAGYGKKLAAAAVPLAFGSMFNKAYGQAGSRTIPQVLEYAYLLENLEAEFYKQAVVAAQTPAIGAPAAAVTALTTIRDHEVAHVNFLRTALTGLNVTPQTYTAASFDFTAGGAYANVFTNYGTMLAVAQAFEDTGVRAYKGQVGFLVSNNDVLQAALQIHSVEARHAAHIRRMRRDTPGIAAAVKPWITMKDPGGVASIQAVYNGEEITEQATVQLANKTYGGVTISANAASEAFDEPLTAEQVTAIVDPFIR